MKKALLVVSFGTSYPDTCEKNIVACERELAASCPDRDTFRAFTSGMIIRKLKQKGWVEQVRNQNNNREYNLFLTEAGWQVFNDHHKFEQACYARTFQKLKIFTDEELELFCRVQQRLNEAFKLDVEDSCRRG